MKRSYKILTVALVAGALISGGVFVNSTMASQDDEKMATKAVQEYVTGFKNGDIETMTKYIKDSRVTDEAQLKKKYESYVKQNKEDNSELKFVSIKKIDTEKYVASFEISSKDLKATTIQLPVIKENDEWRIFVDGSVTVDNRK